MEQRFISRSRCVKALNQVLADSPDRQASRHFKNHIPRLSWAISTVPKAPSGHAKLLDIGSKLDILEIFRQEHGYKQISGSAYAPDGEPFCEPSLSGPDTQVQHYDGERNLIACDPGTYDTVTCFEVIEHMKTDPMALIGNINRAMAMGGHLVLSTLNCASLTSIKKILRGQNPFLYGHFNLALSPNRHNKEYTTKELRRTVACGGFEILRIVTPFVFSTEDLEFIEKLKSIGLDSKYLGDDTIILAKKISDEIVRFPAHLYVGGDDSLKVDAREVFSSRRQVTGLILRGRSAARAAGGRTSRDSAMSA